MTFDHKLIIISIVDIKGIVCFSVGRRGLSHMKKILDPICKGIEWILAFLMGGFSIIILLQIMFRYILGTPLIWSEQVSRYMFIWGCMLAVPLVFREGRDICFDLLRQKLPVKIQNAIFFITDLLLLAFAGLYLYYSFQFCVASKDLVAAGIRIKTVYIYAAQPICAFLLILVIIEAVINKIKGAKKGEVK